MHCKEIEQKLERYFDNELSLSEKQVLDEHLSGCSDCARILAGLDFLKHNLAEKAVYQAPAGLQRKINTQLALQIREEKPPFSAMPWLGFSGGVMAMVTALVVGVLLYLPTPQGRTIPDEVISAHVRSLLVDHITDVSSNNSHTVKPWFSGKLDYSPPVPNLARQGFPLIGGRLDYFQQRSISVMVYRQRAHIINLFVWPVTDGKAGDLRKLSRQGFHLRHWQKNGLQFWLISDLNQKELDRFVRLLHRPA